MNHQETTMSLVSRSTNPIDAIETMGQWFAKSGFFGCERAEQGQILALAAITEGKSPFEIADTYHIVGGRLVMKTRAMLAAYRKIGGRVKWIQSDDKVCNADWTFEGDTTRVSFTIEEAQKQGLIKQGGGWVKVPAEMLRARCTTRAITMLAPEILVGGDDFESAPAAPVANILTVISDVAPEVVTQPEIDEDAVTFAPLKQAFEAQGKQHVEDDSNPALMPVPKRQSLNDQVNIVPKPETVDEASAHSEKILKIQDIVEGVEREAIDFLTHKEWIFDGNILTLSSENADRIIAQPAKFMRAVKAHKA